MKVTLLIEEAHNFKIILIHNVGIADKDVEQYLIDLYYKSIKVEILEG